MDSALVSFPETLRIEGAADFAETRVIDLRGRNVDAYAYLRAVPEMVRVAVVDPSGRELATASLPRRVAVNRAPAAGRRLLAAAQSALSPVVLAQSRDGGGGASHPPLPPHCAHVLVLEGEADRARARGIAFEDRIVRFAAPGPTQRAIIHAALNMMTPMLCHGVSRIALAEVDHEGLYGAVNGFGPGDLMVINVAADYADVRLTLALDGASTALSEVAWPRGVYPLGLLDANTFHLRLDGTEAGDFNVYDGFALVAESSNQRIAGSVVINKALRPHAPLPVPQVFDPPLIVRFLIEK